MGTPSSSSGSGVPSFSPPRGLSSPSLPSSSSLGLGSVPPLSGAGFPALHRRCRLRRVVLRRLLRRVRISRGASTPGSIPADRFAASGGRAAAVRVGDACGGAVFWPASGGLERAAGRGFGVCGGFDGCTDDATAAGGSAASVRVGCDAEAGGAGVGSGPCRAASRSGAGVDECRRGCAATSWRGGVGCGRMRG